MGQLIAQGLIGYTRVAHAWLASTFGSVATAIVAAMAAVGFVFTVYTFYENAAEAIFLEYTQRYRETLLELPFGFFSDEFQLATIKSQEERDRISKVVQAYVDICSEEVKLRLRCRVLGRVWRDWSDGIRYGMMSTSARTIISAIPSMSEYRVLWAYLNQGMKSARREYRHPPGAKWEALTPGKGPSRP